MTLSSLSHTATSLSAASEQARPRAIEVRGLSKVVPDVNGSLTILDDIELNVEQGESVAIVGASGSGKSTLLALLAGLDVPSHGTVLLGGQSIFELDEDARAAHRAAHVGFVFQNFQLIGHMTALENVMLPMELRGDRQARVKAQTMLARVGLGERLGHRPALLSGGEQQRVALARAFVMRPAILMADEPTGSLDHATGQSVMDLMFELNRELGTTLILVTHDEKIAQRCLQRIHIQAGRLMIE